MRRYLVRWPVQRLVTAEQLIALAVEAVENGDHPGPEPRTLGAAMTILHEIAPLAEETYGEEMV